MLMKNIIVFAIVCAVLITGNLAAFIHMSMFKMYSTLGENQILQGTLRFPN